MQIRPDKIFGLGPNPYCLVRLNVPEDGPRGARGNEEIPRLKIVGDLYEMT